MKSYFEAPEEVSDRVAALIRKFHPDLKDVALTIDLLFATTDSEDGHAVTHAGYPALATVRIIGLKDRVAGRKDAEIVIDQVAYEEMTSAQRDALLDHELYHLEVKRTKLGAFKRDDHGRPSLKMRKHDRQFGWFDEIARRHGENSHEVRQARDFAGEAGQLYLGLTEETVHDIKQSVLPTEDSAAHTATPLLDKMIERAEEGRGVCGFVDMAKRSGASVEIRTGDKSVKIDANGVHAQPSEQQLDDATKLAHTAGYLSRALLQREMRVSYNMACAIVGRLVAAKTLAPENDVGRFAALDAKHAHAPEPAASPAAAA